MPDMTPETTIADEFYSLCREQDCKLDVDQVRLWHDRILKLESRLAEAERGVKVTATNLAAALRALTD